MRYRNKGGNSVRWYSERKKNKYKHEDSLCLRVRIGRRNSLEKSSQRDGKTYCEKAHGRVSF